MRFDRHDLIYCLKQSWFFSIFFVRRRRRRRRRRQLLSLLIQIKRKLKRRRRFFFLDAYRRNRAHASLLPKIVAMDIRYRAPSLGLATIEKSWPYYLLCRRGAPHSCNQRPAGV